MELNNLFNSILVISLGGFLSLNAGNSLASSHSIEYIAEQLSVEYELIDSKPSHCPAQKSKCYFSRLHLTLPKSIKTNDFNIYFSQLMPIYQVQSEQFDIEHINGDLHKIMPKPSFTGFEANTPYQIDFYTQDSQITRSEFMPNYLIAPASDQSIEHVRVISSTKVQRDPETQLEKQPYLRPFSTLNQLQVSQHDHTPWMDSQYLYQSENRPIFNQERMKQQTSNQVVGLIPTPTELNLLDNGRVNLAKGLNLPDLKHMASLEAASQRLSLLGVHADSQGIPLKFITETSMDPQAYKLTIKPAEITIEAQSESGFFYGMISLAALVDTQDLSLPAMEVYDAPHYEFRGMHLDVARNFLSKKWIFKLIEQMAAYKLNKLHLHLADDEGWRLEIPGLPELTDVGSVRCLDLTETQCLLPQLGAGHDPKASINGYFSTEDYQEIIRFAAKHHIEVIPSLDMPGHSRAAIIAMEARYKKLMSKGQQHQAEQYRLKEPGDLSEYRSIQHYSDNTLNPCISSTYDFFDTVLDAVINLHDQAGVPLKTYHVGADETAGAWIKSPACKKLKALHSNITSLNGYFIEQISQRIAQRGLKIAAWNDGLSKTQLKNMPKHVQSNGWAVLSEQGHQIIHQQANQGWEMVLSIPEASYFDFPYQSHPEERGNHWASRAIDLFKIFSFMPDNLPAHAEIWHSPYNQAYQSDDRSSVLDKQVRFKGIQGQLWTEMIRSELDADYMIFPRLLVLAERAWHKPNWAVDYDTQGKIYSPATNYFSDQKRLQRQRAWHAFSQVLGEKELLKLELSGVNYRIPTVAAKLSKQGLDAFTSIPGLKIEYQDKQGQWHEYLRATKPTFATAVRAVSNNRARKGRALKL